MIGKIIKVIILFPFLMAFGIVWGMLYFPTEIIDFILFGGEEEIC